MSNTKTLELIFTTDQEKSMTISIENPTEPVDVQKASAAMDTIIQQAIFKANSGKPEKKKEVRLVERKVDSYTV
ncbi:MAG: DUF2922 domain-containing protein [Bacillus sp. (in: firmicutes)]